MRRISDLDLDSDIIKVLEIRYKWLPFFAIVKIYTQKGFFGYKYNYLIAKSDLPVIQDMARSR